MLRICWSSHVACTACCPNLLLLISINYPFFSPDEPLPELLVALVGGQVEPVEARVRPGVAVGVAPLLDGEQLRPVAPVQLLEAVHRHARRPRHELRVRGIFELILAGNQSRIFLHRPAGAWI